MNIFLLNKNLEVCNVLSSKGDVNSSPFFNDTYIQYLETGAETFEFEALQVEYLEIGNYVAFSYDNGYKLFQISEITDTHENNLISKVYCEMAGLELTYEVLRPRDIPSANVSQFFENVLSETFWKVGYVDDDINDVFAISIESYDTIYNTIQEWILKYECEISFRVEIKNNRVVGRYIDIYKQRGSITNNRFEYSDNVSGVIRSVNAFELCTALIGTGKDGLDFKSAVWSKDEGDPVDKPEGQDFIADETAFRLYNNNGSHLMGYFECDKESAYDILQATYKELKRRSVPKVEYEIESNLFDLDETRIGDTIYVIDNDFKPKPLHLSARVNELHISFTNNTNNKCILSNFKTVKSKITDDMRSLANKLDKLESSTFYGVAKGGFLTSQVSLDNGKIEIKNNLLDDNGREYYFDVKGKSYDNYIKGLLTYDSRYVTQAFALDLEDGYIYTSQVVTETNPEHILISKIRLGDKVVEGHMRLFGFGHGSQIGLDKLDGVTKIWVECDGLAHVTTGRLFGTKICRLEFVNGAEYTNHAGNVYDLVPDARNIQVNVDVEGNRLSVKYITISNKNGINVYDLKSVINNSPRVLAKISIPKWLETSTEPNQGHSVCGNMVYHYQGGETSIHGNNTRVTAFDFKGNILSTEIITAGIKEGLSVREPEGIYVKKTGNNVDMYIGFSEGEYPNRKFHIYKYDDVIDDKYSKRGTFKHPNGYFANIDEGHITLKDNPYISYLLYKDNCDSSLIQSGDTDQFIIANIKLGKWYSNGILIDVSSNDCVVGEIENNKKLTLYTSSNDGHGMVGLDGENGQDGKDAYFVELSNEFHSIPTDGNGNNAVYDGCSTEIKLYRADVRLTSGVEYSISTEENVVGTLTGDTYVVTSLSADVGYVDLSATYSNNTYTKRFSLSKNKQGFDGETPIIYWLSASASCISKTTEGKFKPSSITFWSKKQEGNSTTEYYKGIFKIYESTDGDNYILKYTSSEPDDTKSWSVSNDNIESLKCELYLSDGKTLIDQDIIHIVKDGANGFSGADAKYVSITGDMIFRYENGYSSIPKPTIITLTGTPFNLNSTEYRWHYRNEVSSEWTALTKYNGSTEIDIVHNDSTIFANNSKTASIKFSVGDCEDIISLARLCDGTDGYFILLTNESHSVPCENNGDVIVGGLDDAKTQIFAYKGATEVSFTLKSKTDKGCTSSYNSATKTLTITSLSSANASVTLEISVDGATFTKVMTITKAIKGDTGAGVSVLGTLPSEADLPNFGNIGDAYIIMGDLYVWSVNDNDWINVGQIKGDQGIQGVTGADGKTYYTWIKYSDNSNGNPMYDDPQDSSGIYRKYMGIAYNKEVQQESTSPSDYSWIKIVGEDGKDGESSYVANLTNDSHTIPSDENGNNANYTGCKTTIELCHGSTKITSGLTYTYSASTGVTGSGSNGTYTITGMSTDSGYVDLTVKYNNESYTKRFTISKSRNGSDSYSVSLSNDSHVFSCDSDGNIISPITINTSVLAFKGTTAANPVIGTLPTVSGLTLTKSDTTVLITAKAGTSLATNGSFEIPVTVDNTTFNKVFSWSKVKDGANGSDGIDGSNGTSPILVTIDGQSYMKYIDTNTPPVPSSITLTCNAMEGSSQITPTYLWQYKSNGEWLTFDGTNNAKTYTLNYNSKAFVDDVVQIRVRAAYKNVSYYAEHTIAKIYDNKYISKQEIFDKITEGGTNQLIYKDPSTGEIYINATYIKTGQFVADLIKGGLLTLGGTGENDLGDYGRLRILDYTGENELASLDGGEMKIEELTSHNITVDELSVNKINCSTFVPSITETMKIYIDATNGSDDIDFENGATYQTLQCALNTIPRNLNGFTVDIILQTAVSENIVIRGFSSGTLNLYMNKKAINGYVVVRDCSAQIFVLGGLSTTDIEDGIDNGSLRPNIQPSQLFSFGGYNYSFVAIGCTYVYVRSVDIFGKTGTTTNYCGGATNGSNVYVQNVNAYASNSGWNIQNGAKLTTKETYGMCERLGYNVQSGGTCHICNGYSTGGETNTYVGNGGQIIQGSSITFVSGVAVGSNTNTTTNTATSTYTATSGDSYKVKYSSWRKDNTVRQGDWSGCGLHKGCWFFGNQFTELKGKTIKSIKLTIKRQSGGNSGNTSFTLKMHNHSSRPSGSPTYLSTWSKNVALSVGSSTTINITDSAVIDAIKNGTMKGFGIEVTSTSNSYYGILNPSLKAVVTY